MSGFDNEVLYSIGERLEPSTTQAIGLMQKTANDVSIINHSGDPEGAVAANPSSLSHDPSSGDLYVKVSGTGTTRWLLIDPLPNKVLDIVDDFFGNNNNNVGTFNWASSGPEYQTGTATNPGIIHYPSSPGSSAYVYLGANIGPSDTGVLVLGSGKYSQNFVVRLTALSDGVNSFKMYIGLWDEPSIIASPTGPPIDGIYFVYTHNVNSGNWQIVTIASSVATTTNTAVAADTNFNNFGIKVNAAASSVTYTINGIDVGTIITNIPVTQISPVLFFENTLGSAPGFDVDLFYARLILNTSR